MSMRSIIVIFAALSPGGGTVNASTGEEALSLIHEVPRVVMPLDLSVGVPMPKYFAVFDAPRQPTSEDP